MKITITIDIDTELIKTHRDMSQIVGLISWDIHQGHSGGFIRNQKTGEEGNRWELCVVKNNR